MVSRQQVVLCNVVGIVGVNVVYDVGVIPVCAYVWSWSWMGMREYTVGQVGLCDECFLWRWSMITATIVV